MSSTVDGPMQRRFRGEAWFPGRPTLAVPRPDSQHLAVTSVVLLVIGTALAAATTSDPHWWQLHFSELGTHRDFSGAAFNTGSMSAGGLLLVFAARVRQELAEIRRQIASAVHARTHIARLLVCLIASFGLHLALVGLVPLNVDTALHERGASGTMLSFLGILCVMLASPWTPRRLRLICAGITVLLVPAIVVFVLGGITLATLEIIGFGLIFVWLVTFSAALRRATGDRVRRRHEREGGGAAVRRVTRRAARGATVASAARARPVSGRMRPRHSPARPPSARPSRRLRRALPRHPSLPLGAARGARAPLPRGCRG